MQLMFLWSVIPVAVLALTGPLAAWLFIRLLQSGSRRGLALLIAGLALAAVLLGAFITYTFSNFFPDIGCFITLLTPIAAIITLLSFRLRSKKVYALLGDDRTRRRWFIAGSLLLPLLQLAAPAVGYAYGQGCDALNRRSAAPIIAALQAYQAETGAYLPPGEQESVVPGSLDYLIPTYLAALPPRSCFASTFDPPDPILLAESDWNIYACNNTPGDPVLLMVPILGSYSQQIYNLNTNRWSRGNSMDGYCNYLP